VSIEQQLREDYERSRTPGPARTGAYDRFLRRRARYARRVAAAASVTLAAAVALGVTVPRLLADGDDVANQPKGQVVSRPTLGYELVVPPGWRVGGDGSFGMLLVPVNGAFGSVPPTAATTKTSAATSSPSLPSSVRIAVAPVILDPSAYPGLPAGAPAAPPEGPQLNGGPQPEHPEGRFESGPRADGRAYRLYQTSPAVAGPGQTYYLAWPYHCASGVRCPPALRYRALRVTAGTPEIGGQGLQPVWEALRRIADTVRPITNALPGGAAGNRPACELSFINDRTGMRQVRETIPVDGIARVGVSAMTEGGPRGTSDFFLTFSSAGLAMCHLQKRFTVEFVQSGRRVAVRGDTAVVTLAGNLPEADGEFPTMSKAWLWRNWCGNPNATVTIRFRGLDGFELDAANAIRPPCVDAGKPSTLEPTSLPIKVGG
jgi:hypothetical protein